MADAASWWLRPRFVFSALATVVVIAVLLAPSAEMGTDEPYLTSYSFARNGARGFHDIAARLGWRVERRLQPFRGSVDSVATYAVLMPPIDLTSAEVSALLGAVRAGAGLIVIPATGSPIADSLGLRQSRRSGSAISTTWATDSQDVADSTGAGLAKEPRDDAPDDEDYAALYDLELRHVLETTRPLPDSTVSFLSGRRLGESAKRSIVLGRTLGRGRVVAVADPRLLLNDRMRDSGFAELPVRLLEWLSPQQRGPVIFDEYHQGFGRHASLTRTVGRGLVHTPAGRAIVVLGVAALLLLLSRAIRPMPPRPRQRIERRSPLEHVTALARAYEQVGATRTAARSLVRGLRRRRIAGRRAAPDADLLRALAERHPGISAEVDRILVATETPVPASELLAVGRAIATIERTIYQ